MVLAENLQFHKFIILTMMLLFPHDYAYSLVRLSGKCLMEKRFAIEIDHRVRAYS